MMFAVVAAALAPPVQAHPDQDLTAIRIATGEWARALQNGDSAYMDELLHPDFESSATLFPGDRRNLLSLLQEGLLDFERVELKHATFNRSGQQAQVEPVIFYLAFFQQPKALALQLARQADRWRITAIADSKNIPRELIPALPEQQRLHPVTVRVRDAKSGAPVFSRVHVRDKKGEYWPPAGHMKDFPIGFNNAVGGDVMVDGRRFAYVESEFMLPLAVGSYTMELAKGMEYVNRDLSFEVTAGSIPELDVDIARWIDMNERGWYSGDTHIHFLTPQAGLLEARAEDLNVANVLAAQWAALYTDVVHFTGAPSAISDARHIVYVNEEARHPHLGHTVLLNLRELVYPMGWGTSELQNSQGIHGGLDYPPMAFIADAAKQQGGLVSWAHFPNPGAELAVDFALGKIDAVDLMTWADPLSADGGPRGSATDAWYRLLNAGFRAPALGGTDKMFNMQIAGSVRTYVKIDEEFNYANWIEGIRAGRTFATSGPMLEMTVEGRLPGASLELRKGTSVAVVVKVDSMLPVEAIEIVMNGEVIERMSTAERSRSYTWSIDLPVREGGWLAARTYSDHRFTHQRFSHFSPPLRHFAHTSPVYLEVDGATPVSVSALSELLKEVDQVIEWAETRGSYADNEQREEMLAVFNAARRRYEEKLQRACCEPTH